jgi:hypothetical protein
MDYLPQETQEFFQEYQSCFDLDDEDYEEE